MRSIHVLLYAVVIASLLLIGSCCCTGGLDDDEIPTGPGDNMFTPSEDVTYSNDAGGFVIPAGVTVTGAPGPAALGIGAGSTTGFVGEVYGAASFSPVSVTFNSPVDLSFPVDADDGTYNVYMLSGSTWVMVGTATVAGGTATFSSSSFGTFLVGEMHNEGGGGGV